MPEMREAIVVPETESAEPPTRAKGARGGKGGRGKVARGEEDLRKTKSPSGYPVAAWIGVHATPPGPGGRPP